MLKKSSKTPRNFSPRKCTYFGTNSFQYHKGLIRKKKLKSGYLELRFSVLILPTFSHCLAAGMQNWDEAVPKKPTAAQPLLQLPPLLPQALTDTDCSCIYTRQTAQPCVYSFCLMSEQYCTTQRCALSMFCEPVRPMASE